ncbi:hypothetical protein ACQ4XT_11405 [Halobacillus faecis]
MATLISTPQDLDNIRNDLSGTYELVNDIDMSSWGNWTPISEFGGYIDGKGFKLINLTVNFDGTYGGLIGRTSSTFTAKNLGFENVDISITNYNAGALVGYTSGGNTVIDNCFVEGGIIQSQGYAGGLIGNLRGTTTVKNCYAILDTIYTTNYRSSGFIGAMVGDNHLVENCYSVTYNLTSADPSEVFGFAWYENNSTVTNCFWDTDVSGVTQSHNGTGKTTQEMQTQSTYTNWDFTSTWGMNGDYPYLQVFGSPAPVAKTQEITVSSYVGNINSPLKRFVSTNKKVESSISPIMTHTEASRNVLREVEGYVSSINSNVSKSVRTLKSGNKNVTSFVKPFNSSLDKQVKLLKLLDSHVKQINANTDVFIPLNTNIVNAYLSVLTNVSETFHVHNQSITYQVENPSILEVKE